MGERFYLAQVDSIGTCPGIEFKPSKRRKKKVAWTDEEKQQVIEMYTSAEPTPETSMEIVNEIADELEKTPNGVRMILTKANVYIKKTPDAKPAKGGGTSRVSKEEAQSSLKAAISDAGQEVDDEIISKLTGKASVYLANVIKGISG